MASTGWRVDSRNALLLICMLAIIHAWATVNAAMPPGRNAYATMMYMGTPRDYEFYVAVRVMLRSLRRLNVDADLVLIASRDVPSSWINKLVTETDGNRSTQARSVGDLLWKQPCLEATMLLWELDSGEDESIETDIIPTETTTSVDKCETVNNHGGLYCSPLYGGPGGFFWNDGTYSGIRRITMRANQHTLTSLRLDYGIEGDISVKDRHIRGVRHGGTDGTKIVYDLNYPEEIVTKISGYYDAHWHWFMTFVIVKSLTFHTNQRRLGPCGPEYGTYFETEQEGKIVGLHGFGSCGFVDSIGVYMLKL